ncbi:GlcG/HbpS family heme-binding protein [Deinococcus sp.]|uniref:GlcG/HbpS family heme-binding protein n=1 Tax=Deinococcus sp. TaxID=47478 RepID=UPI003CC69F07
MSAEPLSIETQSISLAAARALVEAACAAAADLEAHVTVAVTDAAGHLRALGRMDRAALLSAEVAQDKAWTAAAFGLPTHAWPDILQNPALAQLAHRPRLLAVPGGYPVMLHGQMVGGLGVSGGRGGQDGQIAMAALSAVGFELPG